MYFHVANGVLLLCWPVQAYTLIFVTLQSLVALKFASVDKTDGQTRTLAGAHV